MSSNDLCIFLIQPCLIESVRKNFGYCYCLLSEILGISIANTLEITQSCTKPSIYSVTVELIHTNEVDLVPQELIHSTYSIQGHTFCIMTHLDKCIITVLTHTLEVTQKRVAGNQFHCCWWPGDCKSPGHQQPWLLTDMKDIVDFFPFKYHSCFCIFNWE